MTEMATLSEKSKHQDDGQVKLLFSNSGEVVFLPKQFLKDFIYHVLGPVFGPVVCYSVEGSTACRNRSFYPSLTPMFIIPNLLWTLSFISAVLYFTYMAQHPTCFSGLDILSCFLFTMMRCAVIAIKYAYTSPQMLKTLRKSVVDAEWQKRSMIISGWLRISAAHMAEEIESVERCLKFNLKKQYFLLDMDGDGEVCSKGNAAAKVSAREFLIRVFRMTEDQFTTTSAKILFLSLPTASAFMIALTPIFGRWFAFGDMSTALYSTYPPAFAAVVISAFSNFMITQNLLLFLMAGVADAQRRRAWKQTITELVRPQGDRPEEQLVDLSTPQNVALWLKIRQISQMIGLRYRKRVEAYSSLFSIAIAALTLFSFFNVGLNSSLSSAEKLSFMYTVVLLVTFTLMSAILIFNSSQLNAQDKLDLLVLQEEVMRLRRLQLSPGMQGDEKKESRETINKAVQLLTAVAKNIRQLSTAQPVRVLGFTATPLLLQGLITLVFSGLPLLLSILRRASTGSDDFGSLFVFQSLPSTCHSQGLV